MKLPRIGYLLDTFPAASETFILREVQQLLRDGVDISIAALRKPAHLIHQEAEPLLGQVGYRPLPWTRSFWTAAGPEMARPLFGWICFRLFMEGLGGAAAPSSNVQSPIHNKYRSLRLLCHVLPTAAWLAGHFRQKGVRHIHAHFLEVPGLIGRVTAQLMQVSFSLSVHGSDLHRPGPFDAGNLASARFILTCTARNQKHIRERLPSAAGRHVYLVYHGLDLEQFSFKGEPDADQAGSQQKAPILLCVARLVPKKGIDVLLAACGLLHRSDIPFRCEVLGEGPEGAALREQAQRLGIAENVQFRGICSQEEVRETCRRSTLFVLPCRVAADGDQDGIPNVLVEALAAGLPVISTPVGAVEELIVHGETGLLAPPEDPAALAEQITWLLEHQGECRRLARAGRQRVERDFDLDTNRVREVFLEELGGKL